MSERRDILGGVVRVAEILSYLREDHYVDKHNASEYLSLSPRFIEAHLDQIPHYRCGPKKLLFKLSELNRWMESHREATTAVDVGRVADEVLKKVRGAK